MTTPVIKPTVGRKVWYRNNGSMQKLPRADGKVSHPEFCGIEQPMDATVIFVHGSRMVNLDITDHVGQRFVATSVPLLQDGDAIPDLGCYCEWMPYQQGQARKDAAGEKPTPAACSTLPVVDPGPDSLEREIQAKAGNRWEQGQAPRVTMDMVNAQIVGETYTVLPSGRVTVCELTLKNGFTVRGESAVVFIENNVPQTGREIARKNAVDQIWPLLGFRLRDELARPVLTDADAAADLAGTPRPDNPTAEAADFLASVKACDLSGDASCEACQ